MSKKSRKEGNQVACLIKANKTEFYIADVDLEDDVADVVACVDSVVKTLGKLRTAFMLISAGTTTLTVVCHVPDEIADKINAKEWIQQSLVGIPHGDLNDNYVSVVIDSPFKLKDMVRGNGFAYLKRLGLMADAEDESSEEFIGLDDF